MEKKDLKYYSRQNLEQIQEEGCKKTQGLETMEKEIKNLQNPKLNRQWAPKNLKYTKCWRKNFQKGSDKALTLCKK